MMDQIILEAFPLLAAKRSGELETPLKNGMRYVVTNKGLLREISLPWIYMIHSIASVSHGLKLPYGTCQERIEFLCGPVPAEPIVEFIDLARQVCPIEVAGAILWNANTKKWRFEKRESTSSSSQFVDFKEVELRDGEHLVLDVHSHGDGPAFFSARDDKDDSGTMRISLVIGDLHTPTPTTKMRLCMAGVYYPAIRVADGKIKVVENV